MVQMPFADLRGLYEGACGRLARPDWNADDPGEGFIQGFGQLSTRNGGSYGLHGERFYAAFPKALRFPSPAKLQQEDWPAAMPLRLWFRRLYFDGAIAGRIEIGFQLHRANEDFLAEKVPNFGFDLGQVARTICDTLVEVRSPDGSVSEQRLEICGEALGLAYLTATTSKAARHDYPVADVYGKQLLVGSPSYHLRLAEDQPIIPFKDRKEVVDAPDDGFFLTSVANSTRRNTITVQLSKHADAELPHERARRVLFSHLNALLFANSHLVATMDAKEIARSRMQLRDLTGRMIARLEKMTANTAQDEPFVAAMQEFSSAYAGRIDQLVEKLEALEGDANAPGTMAKIGGYAKGLFELVTTTAVKAGVEATMQPR